MRGRGVAQAAATVALLAFSLAPRARAQAPARAASRVPPGGLNLPPAVKGAVERIYAGDPAAAISAAGRLEADNPQGPLGYLVEAEARWWQLSCEASQVRYGMVDVWALGKQPREKPYLNAAQKVVELAEAQLARRPTAQAHLWAGMGYALEARYDGLRGAKMATARAGVKARAQLIVALRLDPRLADADTGLGLYNYYVDTLSPVVKMLRIFLGIPGGNKQKGVQQLRAAMEHGQLTAVEARYYLAKNLRTYDRRYAQALEVAQPLERAYPQNPIFLLLVANLEIELGRREQAAETLAQIGKLRIPDAACAGRTRSLARELASAARGTR